MNLPASRDPVQCLEDMLLAMPQADIRTFHTFSRGVYERKIVVPPWTVLTGAEHKTPYRVRLESGRIAVNIDGVVRIIAAPCTFAAAAGVKRVGRVLDEEVIWVDVYDNEDDCTDLNELERRLYVVPECGLGENRVAGLIRRDADDYALFLKELGTTQPQIDAIVQITHDLIPMPTGFDVELRPSRLHGTGLFALRPFAPGELICPGRINGCRTPAGRFINHSADPNAEPRMKGDDIDAIARRAIQTNEEILIDYRDSMKVNFGIDVRGEDKCLGG